MLIAHFSVASPNLSVYITRMEGSEMTNAKNSLGRGTGRRFNMTAIKREMKAKQIVPAEPFEVRFERMRQKREGVNWGNVPAKVQA